MSTIVSLPFAFTTIVRSARYRRQEHGVIVAVISFRITKIAHMFMQVIRSKSTELVIHRLHCSGKAVCFAISEA